MDGFLPIFFLLVVLKIPVLGALWLIWWASKSPEAEAEPEDSGGGFERRRPLPTRPRGPHHLPGGAGAAKRRKGAPAPRLKPRARPAFARVGSHADRDGSRPRSCDASS